MNSALRQWRLHLIEQSIHGSRNTDPRIPKPPTWIITAMSSPRKEVERETGGENHRFASRLLHLSSCAENPEARFCARCMPLHGTNRGSATSRRQLLYQRPTRPGWVSVCLLPLRIRSIERNRSRRHRDESGGRPTVPPWRCCTRYTRERGSAIRKPDGKTHVCSWAENGLSPHDRAHQWANHHSKHNALRSWSFSRHLE
jgi:hypothetical protein